MSINMIVVFLIVVQMMILVFVYREKSKQIEKLNAEKEELENHLKLNSADKEVIRIAKIFRSCGFPPVFNPKCESCQQRAERNLWYFKAALKIQNYDLNLFTDGEYQHIKSEISESIPRQRLTRDFGSNNAIIQDVLPLAFALSENIDYMTQEVFGDAGIPC